MSAPAAASHIGTGIGRVGSIATAAAGAGLVGGAIWIGPVLAQALVSRLGIDTTQSPVTAELIYTVVIFGAMLALAVAGGLATRIRVFASGIRPLRAMLLGAALGLAGLLTSIGYSALAGTVDRADTSGVSAALVAGIPIIALQVFAEESCFRGWLQPLLARAIGTAGAVAAVAIGFGALHLIGGAAGAIALVNMVGGGILFGLLAARSGGVAGAFAAHFTWNASEQLAFGVDPNPGTGSFGSLIDLDLAGPALWGGSEQGLNASLGMTFALAAIVVPLLLVAILSPRPVRPTLGLMPE